MDVIRAPRKNLHAIMEQSESMNDLYDVSTADVFFLCIDDESKLVPAHKCILAADSQKFREMFFENAPTPMIMDDCTLGTLTSFIRSFYCESFKINRENLVELTNLSEKYDARICKGACWDFIEQMIETAHEEIFQSLDLAITFDKVDLRDQCLSKLMDVGHLLLETAAFVSCSRQVFQLFVTLNFYHRDEVKLFIASIKWAKHRCDLENLDQNHPLNLRFVLSKSFTYIQFHKMTAQQFIQCLRLHADIFNPDELKNISKCIDASVLLTYGPRKVNLRREFMKTTINQNSRSYEALESMFGDVKTANVFFVFGTMDNEQKLIYAHKCVLGAKSRVFKQLFCSDDTTNDNYPISDATYEDFFTFIETFYRKTADGLMTIKNIAKMIELANSYEVSGLLEKCIDFATMRLCSQNIFRILDLCFLYSNADSVSLCLDWIIAHENDMNRAFHSRSLVDCSKKTVEFTLGLNFPNRIETKIFQASIEWAKKSCQQNQLKPTTENMKMVLGNAFDLIRFTSMSPADFFGCALNYREMFSNEEIDKINRSIAAENEDFVQLMDTFK